MGGRREHLPKDPQSCARPASGPAGRRRGAGPRLSCWLCSRPLRAPAVTCTLPASLFLQQLSALEKALASTSALGLFDLWTHAQYVSVTESPFFQLFTVTLTESWKEQKRENTFPIMIFLPLLYCSYCVLNTTWNFSFVAGVEASSIMPTVSRKWVHVWLMQESAEDLPLQFLKPGNSHFLRSGSNCEFPVTHF